MKVYPTSLRGKVTLIHMTISLFVVMISRSQHPMAVYDFNWAALFELIALFPLNLPFYYLTRGWNSPTHEIGLLCAILILNSYWWGFVVSRAYNWWTKRKRPPGSIRNVNNAEV